MDLGNPGVVSALLTLAGTLVVALISLRMTLSQGRRTRASQREIEELKFERERAAKLEDRELQAREQLNLIRRPLADAAEDVQHRLGNIRASGFLIYVREGDARRSETAVLSTTFRLAQYWGVVEFLYGNVDRLRLADDPETAPVADLIKRIGTTFASDRYDRAGS